MFARNSDTKILAEEPIYEVQNRQAAISGGFQNWGLIESSLYM